jgi:hypothetical protein
MTSVEEVKREYEHELSSASSEMEINMIRAEYNYRIKKLEQEGQEAYELAYVVPNQEPEEDCNCGKD